MGLAGSTEQLQVDSPGADGLITPDFRSLISTIKSNDPSFKILRMHDGPDDTEVNDVPHAQRCGLLSRAFATNKVLH